LVYQGLTDAKFFSDCARGGILPWDPACSIIRSMEVFFADADEFDVGEFQVILKAALNANYDGVYYELGEGSYTILDDYLQRKKGPPDWGQRYVGF